MPYIIRLRSCIMSGARFCAATRKNQATHPTRPGPPHPQQPTCKSLKARLAVGAEPKRKHEKHIPDRNLEFFTRGSLIDVFPRTRPGWRGALYFPGTWISPRACVFPSGSPLVMPLQKAKTSRERFGSFGHPRAPRPSLPFRRAPGPSPWPDRLPHLHTLRIHNLVHLQLDRKHTVDMDPDRR
jgi:hypothetical protein